MKRLVMLNLFLFLFVNLAYSQQAKESSAKEIIDKMISVYAVCESYQDEGEVKTIFYQSNGRRTVITPFTTAFVRPSDFRYEFKSRRGEEEWDNYIIWKDATSIKTWWSIKPDMKPPDNLLSAIAGATGVSNGSAATVPFLLMPDLMSINRINSLTDLKLNGEENINGNVAFKIEGNDSRGNKLTVWIDKEKSLLLQIYEKRTINTEKSGSFEAEITTTYNPQINVKVPDDKLAFNVPASK